MFNGVAHLQGWRQGLIEDYEFALLPEKGKIWTEANEPLHNHQSSWMSHILIETPTSMAYP